jgi:FlaG/FlaF family flagellin (archaellin)
MNSRTILIIAVVAALAGVIGGLVASRNHQAPQSFGSFDTNVLPVTPSMSNVWVGTADTLVAGTSTGRIRLEIANISGATSTAQALYCNVGDRPATAYSGIVIQASSTKAFSLDDLTRGAVHCRYPVSASSAAVADY